MWLWDFIRTVVIVILGSIVCMIGAILLGGIVALVITLGIIIAIVLGVFRLCVSIIDYFSHIG